MGHPGPITAIDEHLCSSIGSLRTGQALQTLLADDMFASPPCALHALLVSLPNRAGPRRGTV